MRFRVLAFATSVLACGVAVCGLAAAQRTVRLGDTTGYLARPATAGPHPAVIVIHEWWGLNDWVRQQADRLAAAGYVALAPDLYQGRSATTPEQAMALVRGFDRAAGMRELQAAFRYLDGRSFVRRGQIGVLGWCFGGGLAAHFAEIEPGLKAVVIYYGDIPTDPAEVARIQAPLLGNFGGADRGIPPARVEQFAAELRSAGRQPDIKIYPGMPHAFAGSRATQPAEIAAAHDAWARSLAFLHRHLPTHAQP